MLHNDLLGILILCWHVAVSALHRPKLLHGYMDKVLQLHRCCTSVATESQEGLIINLGSVAALEPMKSTPVYAASKWGIRGWSLSCYDALRQHNVKVVCIHPGIT